MSIWNMHIHASYTSYTYQKQKDIQAIYYPSLGKLVLFKGHTYLRTNIMYVINSLLFLFQLCWDITNKSCIYFRYTMWWFHVSIYYEMITTIRLINLISIISPHIVTFLGWLVVTICKFYSQQISSIQYILPTVTVLYIRSPQLIPLITASLHPLTNVYPFPLPFSPYQPPFYSLLWRGWLSDSTYEIIQYLSFWVWLISLR